MVIHNATFMMEREREGEFIDWLRGLVAGEGLFAESLRGRRVRLSAMREAGGVDYRQAEAQSVAFQVEFDSIEEARKWSREALPTVAARFEEHFGPQAMVFTSVFEEISL
ncbi:MAG: DUF4286 family protein [Muribaculaceae bacterium]|nr:DUF4286 family protein [Muribaculaceae bacterium]